MQEWRYIRTNLKKKQLNAHANPKPHTKLKNQPITDYEIKPHKLPYTNPKVYYLPNKVTHKEENIALILFLVAGFTIWRMS